MTVSRSGIDAADLDPEVRPQDDLFGFANGGWMARTEIPADRGRYSAFHLLAEAAEANLRVLIEEAAAGAQDGTTARKVGDLYASFCDTDRVEALGVAPMRADLAAVAAVEDVTGLLSLCGTLQRQGVHGGVELFVSTDAKNSSRYLPHLEQSGLGLPDESYYREDAFASVREQYVTHIATMLTLAGVASDDEEAAAMAARVMGLETRLAGAHWDRVRCRDAVATYTLLDRPGLVALAEGVPWDAWVESLRAPSSALDEIVVRQPSFITAFGQALAEVDLGTWREWLSWQVVHAAAPYLSQALVDANFAFYGRVLTGTPEQRERWKRGVALIEWAMGEAAGQLYVERHFPPESKARMAELVANLVEAYRRSISRLDWMGEQTRARALDKLAMFTPKIGYPDRWRDYSALRVDRADLVGSVRAAAAFDYDRDLAKLGQPVDRDEWFMTPQTVNAYYNPGMNEIVFPAAILQPPFFDPEADDAANYGGIGSVIGHEIGHGFDDQGSRYDGEGNLEDWWTPEDRSRFEERTAALIAQYDGFEPRALPGHHVNGALTVGENIGDLGGLAIAFQAYVISAGGDLSSMPAMDGFDAAQRFFLGWALCWKGKEREEEALRLLSIDPHSPVEFRANVVRNLDEFAEAFGVVAGDGLYLPPDQRVRIW